MDVSAFYPEHRWELSTENVLATQMFDTLVPSIERHVLSTAAKLVEFNSGILNILPVSRRQELVDFEKDLRVQHSMLWTAIIEYVLPAIETFITGSTRLFDSADAKVLPTGPALTGLLATLRQDASLAARHCDQAESRLQSFGSSWASFHKILDLYAAHPIPKDGQASFFGQFMTVVFQQEPLHSPPEEYQKLLDSSRQLAEECAAIHATLENLANFFRKVIRQYDNAGRSPAWSAKLDFHDLGQRWRRIHAQIGQCRTSILKHQPTLAMLQPPFIFHDDVKLDRPACIIRSRTLLGYNIHPMDEIFGGALRSEICPILERLSTTLRQIPTHIRTFCREVLNYPDEDLRRELAVMLREARLKKCVRLEYDLDSILPYTYFELIESWLGDISEESSHDYINRWADDAQWYSDSCLLASRALEKTSIEWRAIEQWLRNVGARQKVQEEDSADPLWSTWFFRSRRLISPSTTNLGLQLGDVIRLIDDLRQTIELLGSIWEKLSSDIRAMSFAVISANRVAIISSGQSKELINQWSGVSDLIRTCRIDRDRAPDLVRYAPPVIRSTETGLDKLKR
ncbi:hypothetical protein FRC01_013022 [Tulasnella sp. 417]|nr:hypothetical protein FRC01_013022 [Tulasnella sp. 417]